MTCPKCQKEIHLRWRIIIDGRRQIEARCSCGYFFWAPQTKQNCLEADQNPPDHFLPLFKGDR